MVAWIERRERRIRRWSGARGGGDGRGSGLVGRGSASVDLLAAVASYPNPDDKIRTADPKVSLDNNSPFTYVIVDNKTKTQTCIHTPGHPPWLRDELPLSSLTAALDEARIVFFDGRFPETALKIAREQAASKHIPNLVEAERLREGLDDLLIVADYAVCSAKFPKLSVLACHLRRCCLFAAQVAAANCRAFGAQTGLPHRTDPCLAPYLQ